MLVLLPSYCDYSSNVRRRAQTCASNARTNVSAVAWEPAENVFRVVLLGHAIVPSLAFGEISTPISPVASSVFTPTKVYHGSSLCTPSPAWAVIAFSGNSRPNWAETESQVVLATISLENKDVAHFKQHLLSVCVSSVCSIPRLIFFIGLFIFLMSVDYRY